MTKDLVCQGHQDFFQGYKIKPLNAVNKERNVARLFILREECRAVHELSLPGSL